MDIFLPPQQALHSYIIMAVAVGSVGDVVSTVLKDTVNMYLASHHLCVGPGCRGGVGEASL